jgi:TonB family protein
MRLRIRNICGVACFSAWVLASCGNRLQVKAMPSPEYPLPARFQSVQGKVEVRVLIASDGTVISAHGHGDQQVLVHAAEENARLWTFEPWNAQKSPIRHTITYQYTLRGRPLTVAVPATVHTLLPDQVEITAVPLESDYPPAASYTPAPKTKPATTGTGPKR